MVAPLCLASQLRHLGLEGQPALPYELLVRRHPHANEGALNLGQRDFLDVFVCVDDLVFQIRRRVDSKESRARDILDRCEPEGRVIAAVPNGLSMFCCCLRLILVLSTAV